MKKQVNVTITASDPQVFGGHSHWGQGVQVRGVLDDNGCVYPTENNAQNLCIPSHCYSVNGVSVTTTRTGAITASDLKLAEIPRKDYVYVDQMIQPTYARLVLQGNRTAKSVATELDVSIGTVYYWTRKLRDGGYDMSQIAGFRRDKGTKKTRYGV